MMVDIWIRFVFGIGRPTQEEVTFEWDVAVSIEATAVRRHQRHLRTTACWCLIFYFGN